MFDIVGSGTTGVYNQSLIDSNGAVLVTPGIAVYPSVGGAFSVAGSTSAVVAASLAADSTLMSMRMSASSTRKAYVTAVRVQTSVSTSGASTLVPGVLGLQRFSAATPSTGTARTPNRMSNIHGSGSDMTDVRDNNAALTVTSVSFGTLVSNACLPIVMSSGNTFFDWVYTPAYPLVLNAGDGLAFKTQTVMPATQTWGFSYTIEWFEE